MVSNLIVLMNGQRVGLFTKASNGAHSFTYDKQWIESDNTRPISLSMPLRSDAYTGNEVINFFDNLLPDNQKIRERIVSRYGAETAQPFDLLSKVGRDAVGAVTLISESEAVPNHKVIEARELDENGLSKILKGYLDDAPLGMLKEEDDFRISIAGAQEKTALLKQGDKWYIPHGLTPTTHIIKLPIGEIQTSSHTLDLSNSVDNELICMRLSQAFGIPTANCDILIANEMKALAVERFDRKLASNKEFFLRLPHEDFCQVYGLSPANKYESDGGIGIAEIMKVLTYSSESEDRKTFMRSQILFWLLAAIDGHAKNFSLSIGAGGKYSLAPLYDILSAYPLIGGRGLNERDLKMAMSLKATKGRKKQWSKIQPRHFGDTAKEVSFRTSELNILLEEFSDMTREVIDSVANALPDGVNEDVRDKIFDGLLKTVGKITTV
ncbi:type II toxin-antitoxin system HipA family toxin [Vibrio algivorus]|uniref:Serine/threonine-protein kinase HipA n=1 Tax=Vibrio algivorus TaxID=1667024 RepID=A0ABQ6ELB7_9VIBR|nr:type II toxin-antitoxin system HipA family toxin [Vibrio algivorus]GLT13913.1 serine/threonine-protein kinase HipA [Vibrio algivorus]